MKKPVEKGYKLALKAVFCNYARVIQSQSSTGVNDQELGIESMDACFTNWRDELKSAPSAHASIIKPIVSMSLLLVCFSSRLQEL